MHSARKDTHFLVHELYQKVHHPEQQAPATIVEFFASMRSRLAIESKADRDTREGMSDILANLEFGPRLWEAALAGHMSKVRRRRPGRALSLVPILK